MRLKSRSNSCQKFLTIEQLLVIALTAMLLSCGDDKKGEAPYRCSLSPVQTSISSLGEQDAKDDFLTRVVSYVSILKESGCRDVLEKNRGGLKLSFSAFIPNAPIPATLKSIDLGEGRLISFSTNTSSSQMAPSQRPEYVEEAVRWTHHFQALSRTDEKSGRWEAVAKEASEKNFMLPWTNSPGEIRVLFSVSAEQKQNHLPRGLFIDMVTAAPMDKADEPVANDKKN